MPSDTRVPIDGHPGFFRRGEWVVFRYRDRRRRRQWGKAKSLRAAKELRATLVTDVLRGEHRATSKLTVEQYGRKWIESYVGRTSKPIEEHTREDYRVDLEEAYEYFAGMRLVDVEPQDVKSYAAELGRRPRKGKRYAKDRRPLSARTVRTKLAPLKAMFATAFEEGLVRTNPTAGVRIVTPAAKVIIDDDDEGEVKALTEAELSALLEAIALEQDGRWLLFFRVLVSLGLRISEIVELRWRDVDLGARTVKVRRKFYKGRVGRPKSKYGVRTLRLTPELARVLWLLRKETKARDEDLVFAGAAGARVNGSNLMKRVLKPAAVKAGLGVSVDDGRGGKRADTWVGFHTFRHTCATLLFTTAKWNPKQVQVWLGHHSAAFTVDTYVHLLPDDVPEPPTFGAVSRPVERPHRELAAAADA
jgi:integrase